MLTDVFSFQMPMPMPFPPVIAMPPGMRPPPMPGMFVPHQVYFFLSLIDLLISYWVKMVFRLVRVKAVELHAFLSLGSIKGCSGCTCYFVIKQRILALAFISELRIECVAIPDDVPSTASDARSPTARAQRDHWGSADHLQARTGHQWRACVQAHGAPSKISRLFWFVSCSIQCL